MIPACPTRPRPRPRTLGIPVYHAVASTKHPRHRFPGARPPVTYPALSLPATRDTVAFPIRKPYPVEG